MSLYSEIKAGDEQAANEDLVSLSNKFVLQAEESDQDVHQNPWGAEVDAELRSWCTDLFSMCWPDVGSHARTDVILRFLHESKAHVHPEKALTHAGVHHLDFNMAFRILQNG